MRTCSLMILIAMQSSVASAAEPTPTGEPSRKTVIDARELGARYQILGPLGAPLGAVVTIVATRMESHSKDAPDLLRVASMGGKRLHPPVTMCYKTLPWIGMKPLERNKEYELRAYQDGGFTGIPAAAMKETATVQTPSYGFTTHLVILKILQ
jgi:hypothetical protein